MNRFFSGGGQNALTAILAALFQKGNKIAVDNHTYPGIKTAAAMLGLQLVPVPTDSDGMDMDALEVICKNEKYEGFILFRLATIQPQQYSHSKA